jgi:hypothetical protein
MNFIGEPSPRTAKGLFGGRHKPRKTRPRKSLLGSVTAVTIDGVSGGNFQRSFSSARKDRRADIDHVTVFFESKLCLDNHCVSARREGMEHRRFLAHPEASLRRSRYLRVSVARRPGSKMSGQMSTSSGKSAATARSIKSWVAGNV